jgi:nucleoside recognition membrane protein YjiH
MCGTIGLVGPEAEGCRVRLAVLSMSQLLFFSAVIPLLLEIDVPVRLWDTIVPFLPPTVIAIPIILLITQLLF